MKERESERERERENLVEIKNNRKSRDYSKTNVLKSVTGRQFYKSWRPGTCTTYLKVFFFFYKTTVENHTFFTVGFSTAERSTEGHHDTENHTHIVRI